MKKYIFKTLAPIFSISMFITVFTLSIFTVYGYRYDFEEKEVISTSIIDICVLEKKADIYIDNNKVNSNSCGKFYGMSLGRHKVEVKKEGFYTWKKDLYLGNERVAIHKNIILIPNTKLKTTKSTQSISLLKENKKNINNPIIIDGFEIWKKENNKKHFITRYSTPIQSAQYFNNSSNLLISTNSEIYICDSDAENCHLITKKDKNTQVFHKLNTRKIIFTKNNILEEILIKKPKKLKNKLTTTKKQLK